MTNSLSTYQITFVDMTETFPFHYGHREGYIYGM